MDGFVVFERDERYTDSGAPELDWRPLRASLPAGSAPVAIVQSPSNWTLAAAQWFSDDEVYAFVLSRTGWERLIPTREHA